MVASKPESDTRVRIHSAIEETSAADWNRLVDPRYPFLRHEFLAAGERHGCVSPATGWTPRHLALYGADGALLAAMPLYEKTHSWGEFVFDWSWADAYRRAGLTYYPKLVSAAAFTPATSQRLLCVGENAAVLSATLLDALVAFARDRKLSSAHVLFPLEKELPRLKEAGFLLRKDCQFQWRNHGYTDFEHFLSEFSSAKRKKARRERRRVAEAGIAFRNVPAAELSTDEMHRVFELCSYTFLRRGSMPYLDLPFFLELRQTLPESIRVIAAEHRGEIIAAAIFFRGKDTLYGRYWGSDDDYHSLHFETCYYQGIEYCISEGISRFEPGTQGEHKIRRGFLPTATWSAHWLAESRFADAIGDYLCEEARHVDDYMEVARAHTPFRADLPARQ